MSKTAPFLDAIRGDLAAVSSATIPRPRSSSASGGRWTSSLQLRLFDVMGQAALELSEQMPTGACRGPARGP